MQSIPTIKIHLKTAYKKSLLSRFKGKKAHTHKKQLLHKSYHRFLSLMKHFIIAPLSLNMIGETVVK